MNALLHYLAEASVCLTAFYAAYWFLLRQDTFFRRNRWYLVATAVLSVAIPAVSLPNFAPEALSSLSTVRLPELTVGAEGSAAAEAASSWSLGWREVTVIYLTVAGLLLMRAIWQVARIGYFVRKFEAVAEGDYYLVKTGGALPTFSFLRYVFWDDSKAVSAEEADKILRHELAHVRDGHTYDLLLLEALKAVFWFNPVVYLYRRSLADQHEFIADAAVLQRADSEGYARLMVQSLFSELNLHLTHSFNHSQIKKRILMMKKVKSPKYLIWKAAAALPIVALLLGTFSCEQEVGQDIDRTGPTASNTDAEVKAYLDKFSAKLEERNAASGSAAQNAEPVGGWSSMFALLNEELEYPQEARERGVTGKVFLHFNISPDGQAQNIEAVAAKLDRPEELTEEEEQRFKKAFSEVAVAGFKKLELDWSPLVEGANKQMAAIVEELAAEGTVAPLDPPAFNASQPMTLPISFQLDD